MYVVYVLYSPSIDRLYIGQTQNLTKRLSQHREGLARFTSRAKDWKLVYSETCQTRAQAMQREKQLKSHQGRNFLRAQIARGC